ncbi:MAG: GNAT family N-acetyltransferase [Chloroflexi bacterium]|nr:GNAT family N-acetyltransferase [Chloroflexota bacterium]
MIQFRPATQSDQPIITRIIRDADINPMALDWHRFLVAEEKDEIIGVGQIKPHGDGSREIASIAVIPARQGQGIARKIIEQLLAQEKRTVYLTCRGQLESFYTRFGFRKIERAEMPPYFRRIIWIANILIPLLRRGVRIIVMMREPENLDADKHG